ncbi:DUF1501 domain-containing protein [Armatimonas rosea]|uniref:Uncharacterized protein (DUF1501 family) n=1 Tax=Armatimonas rosea TaxID=685828 RepID=A0A7W9SNH9_ARMRO|nr:DUF1501 domain-containing protein [Armatimonas rosea]MBB6049882.1 uncharacterized protein (DUF1501 family) [Armatimonas rosea]
MNVSRRLFLKNGGVALASVGLVPALGPSFLQRAALAQTAGKKKKTLVCVFMRGAADGLSVVVPHGEAELYRARPNIAIPRNQVIDLDGFFGLHPALEPLAKIYKDGHLAAVHACGSPSSTRSHFDAMDYMESGTPGSKAVQDGWLARAALLCPEDRAKAKSGKSPFRAVALGGGLPTALKGDAGALAIPDLRTFGINDPAASRRPGRRTDTNDTMMAGAFAAGSTAGGFEALYDQAVGDVLHGTGKESFEALKMLQGINPARYTPASGANYPTGKLGESLKQIAQLIKADVGVEVAFADIGGWDTHANQIQNGAPAQGNLANKLREVGQALAALYTDLGDKMDDVVVLTMSEFGRTVKQNGTGGTDHGHATCFFALGGGIKGGKVYGDWPGLAPEKLYENRDLALTTDFRAVFGEVAMKHLGVPRLEKLFPGYDGGTKSFRGLL